MPTAPTCAGCSATEKKSFVYAKVPQVTGFSKQKADMEPSISNLIAGEERLKLKLKKIRQVLKKKLEESDIYKQVYEKEIDNEEFKVSVKTAKAHALKVARSNYAEEEGEGEDEESES